MKILGKSLMLTLMLWTPSLWATPVCQLDPSKPKFYRLELTVPATFCASDDSDPSCRNFPKASAIQLHGLWPNYDHGYPEGDCSPTECKDARVSEGKFCAYPAPPALYNSKAWADYKAYMAGTEKCLERHEWVKHGTCTPLNAPEYFDWALRKTKEISDKLNLPTDRPISKAQFDRLAAKNLPQLAGNFNLHCKGNRLESLYLMFEWTKSGPGEVLPNPSGRNKIACPPSFVIPSQP